MNNDVTMRISGLFLYP